jgi:hypothetical protein
MMTPGGDHAATLYMWLRAVAESGEFTGSVHLQMDRGQITRIEIRHELTCPVQPTEDKKGLHCATKRV